MSDFIIYLMIVSPILGAGLVIGVFKVVKWIRSKIRKTVSCLDTAEAWKIRYEYANEERSQQTRRISELRAEINSHKEQYAQWKLEVAENYKEQTSAIIEENRQLELENNMYKTFLGKVGVVV